ncbi:MAG: DNA primase [Pseudomonadota bacterium]
MALPPGFLDDLRSSVSLAQVAGRKLTWDARKSNPGKGDMWAPCPFHQEKTASFHVDDAKGFYYCFGCHAKGDAIGFVKDTENVGFMEAVEILAREAGMTMPARDPGAAEAAKKRSGLTDVMELAVRFYRAQLTGARAAEARDYLARRGLVPDTLERFEIGFAPDARTQIFDHLRGKDISPEMIVETGLCIKLDDGGSPYDRFRGRIMFPIRDARGRCISFGGRAMDPNARAKYLNGPETTLFDKGRNLYNHGPAREASGKTGALIVAEGYMDVIALSQAGFGHAVAPLGTAITEDQLALLWRISDEPVIALDGDKAGIRAAHRLIDIALKALTPGKSLRFCILPEGQDPDDLIKASGPEAMQAQLDGARPMVDLLWSRETVGKHFDSPERRAALDKTLRELLSQISDPSIRDHYKSALWEKRAALFGFGNAPSVPARGGWRKPGPAPATETARRSLLARGGEDPAIAARVRESALLLACFNHPDVAGEFESELERLPFACRDLEEIRDLLLSAMTRSLNTTELRASAGAKLGTDPLELLSQPGAVKANRYLRADASAEDARRVILEELAKQRALFGIEQEVTEAAEDLTGLADEGVTWRLAEANAARDRALRAGGSDQGTDDEIELSEALSRLIEDEVWNKKSGQ